MDYLAKTGQQPAGSEGAWRGRIVDIAVVMTPTFIAGHVVIMSFIFIVFAMVAVAIVVNLFPARSLAMAPTPIIDGGERRCSGGLGRSILTQGHIRCALGPG
jgi:hypothetical protein